MKQLLNQQINILWYRQHSPDIL